MCRTRRTRFFQLCSTVELYCSYYISIAGPGGSILDSLDNDHNRKITLKIYKRGDIPQTDIATYRLNRPWGQFSKMGAIGRIRPSFPSSHFREGVLFLLSSLCYCVFLWYFNEIVYFIVFCHLRCTTKVYFRN